MAERLVTLSTAPSISRSVREPSLPPPAITFEDNDGPDSTEADVLPDDTPTSEFKSQLRAKKLSSDIVRLLQDKEFSLLEIRELIKVQRMLGSFRIIATYSYYEHRAIIVHHRFVLLKLEYEDKRIVWLRLERRPSSRKELWRGFGRAAATDRGRFAIRVSDFVTKSYSVENLHEFEEPYLTLTVLGAVIEAMGHVFPKYSLWSHNCWMFTSIFQEQLGMTHDGSLGEGRLMNTKFWRAIRLATRREVERLFHMPEPLTIGTILNALKDQSKFASIRQNIKTALHIYDQWEHNSSVLSVDKAKLAPKLIISLEAVANELDEVNEVGSAASLWRQMILILRRHEKTSVEEYRVHLALALGEYGVFLFMCNRRSEATNADKESSALGRAVYSDEYSARDIQHPLYPSYRRWRQRALLELGQYSAACVDAAAVVDQVRLLYNRAPSRCAEHLALSLAWYAECLGKTGNNAESRLAYGEAVKIVKLSHLASSKEGEDNVTLPDSLSSPAGGMRGERYTAGRRDRSLIGPVESRSQPNRFKDALAHHLTSYGFTVWKVGAFMTACEAEAEVVQITRRLYELHPDQHRADLSRRLVDYGIVLHANRWYKSACKIKAEAVEHTRQLFRICPDQHRADLAERLRGYGISLQANGSHESAYKIHAEAVEHTRHLFRTSPDQYRADLAKQLREYGISLQANGSYESACKIKAEAVEHTCHLFRTFPWQYRADLAKRLGEYGRSLHASGSYESACKIEAEAVGLTRHLFRTFPDQYRADLAHQLREYSICLQANGSCKPACKIMGEAVELMRHLFHTSPDKYRADLAEGLNSYGISLHTNGSYKSACKIKAEAVKHTRHLFRTFPDQRRADLAKRLQEYGISLFANGSYESACKVEAEVVELTRHLFRTTPE